MVEVAVDEFFGQNSAVFEFDFEHSGEGAGAVAEALDVIQIEFHFFGQEPFGSETRPVRGAEVGEDDLDASGDIGEFFVEHEFAERGGRAGGSGEGDFPESHVERFPQTEQLRMRLVAGSGAGDEIGNGCNDFCFADPRLFRIEGGDDCAVDDSLLQGVCEQCRGDAA